MNKSELVASIAKDADISLAKAEKALEAALEGITKTLTKGDDISLVGFGRFGVKKRAARKGRNPQTGQPIDIKAAKVPFFKAGKQLKEAVDTK